MRCFHNKFNHLFSVLRIKNEIILCSFFTLALTVCACAKVSPLVPATSSAATAVTSPKTPLPFQPAPAAKIETVAKQALLIDFTTGVILLEKNADELMAPSSMTKIMTAYLVFEKLKQGHIQLNTLFPVSQRAWQMSSGKVGGSTMFAPLNSMITVEDLLKGIIIQSGNDACIVIAEGLAGSDENFSNMMTAKAQEMGARQTVFRNSSGWPDPEHQSTARDLAIISHRLITDFPEFYPLFKEKEFVFNKIRQWNRNPLLFKSIGCDGIKTGFTDRGGYGLVASVVQGDRRLILVANGMSSENERANEALKLMMWGLQTFDNFAIFKPGDIVEMIPVWLGSENQVSATVGDEVIVTLPKMSLKGLKVDIEYDTPISAPIEQGAVIGKVIITLPSQELPIDYPLVAATSIGKAGFFKRIKDSFSYLIWGKA